MNTKFSPTRKALVKIAVVCAAIGLLCGGATVSEAQSTSTLSPDLQQVVTLSRQQISDDIITNYIKTSGKTYTLSADDIINLKEQGVSQPVITTLIQTSVPAGTAAASQIVSAPQTPTPASSQFTASPTIVAPPVAPAMPTMDSFQAQLRPYGNWVDVPGYGLCWQPSVEYGWRPYYDGGHWESTDAGWYWQSDYPWGNIAFHYGRWAYTATGWVWVPGYDYAPSWVVWRHADADGYIGWAPLPPGAVFVNGGWEFNHVRVGVDFAFGLGDGFFTFVDYGHLFFDPHIYHRGYRDFVVPRERLASIYRHSVIENRYHVDHGRFVNEGLGRERMAALTHREIPDVKNVRDLKAQDEQRNAHTRTDTMRNFKPATADKGRVVSKAESHENGGHQSGNKNDNGR